MMQQSILKNQLLFKTYCFYITSQRILQDINKPHHIAILQRIYCIHDKQIQFLNIMYYVNTLRGKQQGHEYILFEEILFNKQQYQQAPLLPLTLENISTIKKNPFQSFENLLVNSPVLIAHEFQHLPQKTLVLTHCKDIEKLQELQQMCPHIDIAIGFTFNLQNKYDNDYLRKKLELEISMGTDGIKPAFIGPIIENDKYLGIYQEFSTQFKIPIIVSQGCYENAIHINPIEIDVIYNEGVTKKLRAKNQQSLAKAIYQQSFYGQKLFKYIMDNIQSGIYTSGVQFKCQLKSFGGQGFNAYKSDLIQLFQWAEEKIVVQEIITWTCPVCQKEYGNIEKFRKFNKEFCSIKCLKQGI
ncbi:hypothetical protein pb186bvf_020344 [Paramecium bursaria]